MATNRVSSVFQRLLRKVTPVAAGELSDAELLHRFVAARDEAAFELLIWRHGPMVLGLCERMLRQTQDAEDAFQATFLVLVRKARSIGKRESLPSWLYKVAHRIACRARLQVPLASGSGIAIEAYPSDEARDDLSARELRTVLDEEVARLPETYRRPIVLCYLEGKTNDEAARLLGWPKGTVATRLARARERLRGRLTRRGFALTAATLAVVLTERAAAGALAAEVVRATLAGALAFAAGTTAAGAFVSTKTLALTEGVLHVMWMNKVKLIASAFVALVLAGTGIGVVARNALAGSAPEDPGVVQVDLQDRQEPRIDAKADRADVEKLTREIVKLRQDLEAALKEIKSLMDGQAFAKPAAELGPFYRGKPVEFWLRQAKDGDPKYRDEAITALGALAPEQKSIIPVLIAALHDRDYPIGETASKTLGTLGPDVVPMLLDVLKLKTSTSAHSLALQALAGIGPDAKPAVAQLITVLKNKDTWSWYQDWYSSIAALESIGPHAKPAIPVLVDTLGQTVQLFKAKKITPHRRDMAERIVNALARIEPDIRSIVPSELLDDSPQVASVLDSVKRLSQYQAIHDELKKKHPLEKRGTVLRSQLHCGFFGVGRSLHGCWKGAFAPTHSPFASCFNSAYFVASSMTASSLLSTCRSSQ
jgi:RNA polymerase sigma factor (sigma-70 family)